MSKRIFARISVGVVLALGTMVVPAFADICASTTNCTLHLTQGNGGSSFGTGDFGTVNLALSGNIVTVTVDLANNFFIIGTGFPGAFGFSDSLGGGLTIGGFPANYSGSTSDATSDIHFDGFGDFNNAAATTAPSAGSADALNVVSFTVQKGTSITDVEQLLHLASPVGGDGAVYFVVDAINRNTSGAGAGNTGLLGVTGGDPVPEPSLSVLLGGLGILGWFAHRRRANRAA